MSGFNQNIDSENKEIVVEIKRVSKKTKGGNQMRFTALVVVGDGNGKVGADLSKGDDVRSAIQKAIAKAKSKMAEVPLSGRTIPFEIRAKYNAARVLLKPAPEGSGIIAGGPMRVVLEAAGVRDVVGKIMGTRSKVTNVYATIKALELIKDIQRKQKIKNG
ncbi:MAG: 30S ribosomal protein S5 [Candidatus Woesebacteria bacterium GW2011_GWB1_43_14]|uniref:Small ribosomal subunit protein uS5 n=1 Tax=Candidatus Woesebacteria bacterium GW2011_GWB1_43_14 TaxID=1618578 RepID=A0A0G1DIG9_9BACT|nr:MAG: 30S ribosomal protein S5 [Candidatus Woesebacteria bacterium GW2011_GWA1_39_11b]KKS78033.1 MAG: 30S ribosomal protein S5 [Candidatus Woesebacteria bacterium GW2011_GWC1_42_9]KKS97387.1 MAG: 30S ribosomal protein S5 [Candidatus Woesebacteria bacterium GW2011_GWB1_43_14]